MILAVVLALSSCRAMFPDDLQVTNVQCFPDREGMPMSGLPLPGSYPPGGSQSVFRVTVRTTRNLSAYVRLKHFNPGVSVFPCDDPRSSLRPSGPDYGYSDPSKDVPDSHGFHQYHFYFYSSNYFPGKDDALGRKTYDLAKSKINVCFYFAGGNETGFGYRSNVVMISQDTIQHLVVSPRAGT